MTQASDGDTPNRLFSGYDSVARGMLTSKAVDGKTGSEGGRQVVNIRVCESVSELADALEIDGSLSVSYLKAANVTAKMKFMKSLNVTEKSVTIVVYAAVETGTWRVTKAWLDGIKPPTNDAEAQRFVKAHGDSFIKEATQGGEYYAVYTFRTTTQEEQKSLTTSLKAKGVYSGVTAKAEVQSKITSFTSNTSVDCTLKQEMTGITGISLPSEDNLIQFALDFSAKTMNRPVTTGFAVDYYENLPDFGDGFAKVTANRRYFLGEKGMLAKLARLKALQQQVKRLKDIYACYNFKDPELEAFRGRVETDIEAIENQVTAWTDNPTGNFVSPPLPSLKEGEPVLDFVAHHVASFGQDGGGTFDFMSVGNAFRNQVRMVSIRLFDGTWDGFHVVRKMEIEYASEKGSWTAVHGEGGNPRDKLFFEKGQFVSHMRIRYGRLIDFLEIRLPDGRATQGGGGGGTLTEWTPQPGVTILGFAGRAGAALDQIKIVNASLLKARFVKD